ncbi:MAG: hypothetical protein RQ724_06090 [Desulfuromonadales bacterium]|nr:hypothetical protein [Desulfuromonadales bacterium]
MNSRLARMILLFSVVVLLGMGGMGGVPEGTIPEVEENYSAQIVDREGVVTAVENFSIDGNLYLVGMRGQGQVTVPLRDLKKLQFENVDAVNVQVRCVLRDDTSIEINVRRRSVFYGKGDFGVFQIYARHIKQIVFP